MKTHCKTSCLSLLGLMALMPAQSQVFEPVRLRAAEGFNTRNSLLLQGSQFNWSGTGLEGKTGFLVAGDFAIGKNFGIGGWYASDSQSLFVPNFGRSNANVDWYNFHLSWFFSQRPRSSFGLSTGVLGANISGGGVSLDATWTEINFLAAFALDGSAKHPPRLTLGLTLGVLAGDSSSSSSNFRTADGFSYGASLEYRISKMFSLNAGVWNMSLDTGADITRYNVGLGFHF